MNVYEKLPERVEAIQLAGFTSCGCSPAFNVTERELPTWAKDRLADGRFRVVKGATSTADPLGRHLSLSIAQSRDDDAPRVGVWPGQWLLYSPITGEVSTLHDGQFKIMYEHKKNWREIIRENHKAVAQTQVAGLTPTLTGKLTGDVIGARSLVIMANIRLSDLEYILDTLDVQHASELVMADVRNGFEVLRRAWLDCATGHPVDANRLKRWGGLGA